MLHERVLPAQRTHRLFAQPVRDAGPAEDVAARRDGGVFHWLEAEGAFPLLLAVDPLHDLRIVQIVAVRFELRRVRDLRQVMLLRCRVRAVVCLEQQRGRDSGVCVDLDAAVDDCAATG